MNVISIDQTRLNFLKFHEEAVKIPYYNREQFWQYLLDAQNELVNRTESKLDVVLFFSRLYGVYFASNREYMDLAKFIKLGKFQGLV